MTIVASNVIAKFLHKLRIYFGRPSWFSEIGSGLATLGWGILAINVDAADDWPSSALMFEISKSVQWGVFAIILGLGQICLFQMIDRRWPRPWLRWGAAIAASWVWATITISATSVHPWPPGIAAYFGWWIVNLYLIGRIFGAQEWTK